jgi:hypothetical protein
VATDLNSEEMAQRAAKAYVQPYLDALERIRKRREWREKWLGRR